MQRPELEIVNKLIQFTRQNVIEWIPTDINGVFYTELGGLPYITGTDSIALDDSHECYAYFVSIKREIWEHVAYAQEDDLTSSLDKNDEPIRELYALAASKSSGKEEKKITEVVSHDGIEVAERKQPKIFISHASADTKFVLALVELLNKQGFSQEDVFCSSVPGYGIKIGGNIFETLLNLFQHNDLYVIFVHSPRFYTRAISLNEMGAAWALRTRYFSILTKDMEYDDMDGVVNDREVALKVNDDSAIYRTNELVTMLQDFFHKEHLDADTTNEQCSEFINYVNGIIYTMWGETTKDNMWKVYLNMLINYLSALFGIRTKKIVM